jgi:trimeric autotransporter adhesin
MSPILRGLQILVVLGALYAIGAAIPTDAAPPTTGPVNCVAGGRADGTCNVIGGSNANQPAPNVSGAAIGGGGELDLPNRVTGDYGTIAGGVGNQAGSRASVGGGSYNAAPGDRSTIGGGSSNLAQTAFATIAGGENNIASYFYATIGGGGGNTSSGRYSTIAGGSGNIASFTHATVAGGSYNTASSINSTVGGGDTNLASGSFSTVAGGSNNRASGFNAIVAGGSGNFAVGDSTTIAGGLVNRAYGDYSTIAGGNGNLTGVLNAESKVAHYSAIGGGAYNTAIGAFSTVPGGLSNSAAADFSVAAGRRARVDAAHAGSFLFADSNDFDFVSTSPNEFAVRATGGVRFVTAVGSQGEPADGVRLAPGSGSWSSLSDRTAKSNIVAADPRAVLTQLMSIPMSTWSYKTEDPSVRHLGPMAQDFSAFGLGDDSRYISTVDANGVALAAIQGLAQIDQARADQVARQSRQIADLQTENAALSARVDALASRLDGLEQNARTAPGPIESSLFVPSNLVILGCVGALGWFFGRRPNHT